MKVLLFAIFSLVLGQIIAYTKSLTDFSCPGNQQWFNCLPCTLPCGSERECPKISKFCKPGCGCADGQFLQGEWSIVIYLKNQFQKRTNIEKNLRNGILKPWRSFWTFVWGSDKGQTNVKPLVPPLIFFLLPRAKLTYGLWVRNQQMLTNPKNPFYFKKNRNKIKALGHHYKYTPSETGLDRDTFYGFN